MRHAAQNRGDSYMMGAPRVPARPIRSADDEEFISWQIGQDLSVSGRRPRRASSATRETIKPAAITGSQQPAVDVSAWYHAEAIEDAKKGFEH